MEILIKEYLNTYLGRTLSLIQAMELAIELAEKGLGYVEPNPPVGCVILDKNNLLIGLGFHSEFGGPHAEVVALNSVEDKNKLEGAKIVVTLEPCAHQGKTPSCAKELAKQKISEVYYGLEDPNPLVKGKGCSILEEVGIKTELFPENGPLHDRLRLLKEIFLKNHEKKVPFISVKAATSLDGQIGMKSGESQWVTNEQSRHQVYRLRAKYDAVLVGANTFINDNPMLNVRAPEFPLSENKSIILDPNGRGLDRLKESNLLKVRSPEKIIYVTLKDPPEELNEINIHWMKPQLESKGKIAMEPFLRALYDIGVHSLFVEGGAFVFSEFFSSHWIDRLYLFYGNKIIGSKEGQHWLANWGVETLEQSLSLNHIEITSFGDNFLVTGRLSSIR